MEAPGIQDLRMIIYENDGAEQKAMIEKPVHTLAHLLVEWSKAGDSAEALLGVAEAELAKTERASRPPAGLPS